MPKYVNVKMDKFPAPLVIEADTAVVKDRELLVTLGEAIVARVPEEHVRNWWIEDSPPPNCPLPN
jgi:hypothetical protein